MLGQPADSMTICQDPSFVRALMARQHFDGVFVDFDQPGGSDVVAALRRSESHRNTVCAAITGRFVSAAAFLAGATLVLDKPLSGERSRRGVQLAMSLMMRERRRYHRQSAFFRVVVSTTAQQIVATSVNVSETGLCLWSPAPLVADANVRLRFTLPETTIVHDVEARVAWSEPSGRAGLQFSALPRLTQVVLNDWLAQQFLKHFPENPGDNRRRSQKYTAQTEPASASEKRGVGAQDSAAALTPVTLH